MTELDFRVLDPRIVQVVDLSSKGVKRMHAFFTNGWGVSVITGNGTYGGDEGLYEMLAIEPSGRFLTDKIFGWLTEAEVMQVIEAVALFDEKANEATIDELAISITKLL